MNTAQIFGALNNNFIDASFDFVQTDDGFKNMLFSKIYMQNNFHYILRNKFKFIDFDDAIKNNIIFGTVDGTLAYIFFKKYYPNAKIIEFSDYPMLFEAFKDNIIDSFITYDVVIKNFIEKNNIKECGIFEIKHEKAEIPLSFILNKKNQKLLDQINFILNEMESGVEIDELKKKYGLK
jgi:ABC-type amino acid transport substrate-binding protein